MINICVYDDTVLFHASPSLITNLRIMDFSSRHYCPKIVLYFCSYFMGEFTVYCITNYALPEDLFIHVQCAMPCFNYFVDEKPIQRLSGEVY